MKLLKRAVVIVAVLSCILFAFAAGSGHGHTRELLVVTVRVADRETGRPLDGAVVAIVRYRSMTERFAQDLGAVAEQNRDEDAWMSGVAAARTKAEAITTIRSSVYMTRHWWGPVEVHKAMYGPEVLNGEARREIKVDLVDHPEHGRAIVPLDPKAPTPGDEPRTWRLDLGTVRFPRE